MSRETTFESPGPLRISTRTLTRVALEQTGPASPHLAATPDGIIFHTDGWYEVLMTCHWDPANTTGTRFSHTKIPDQHPLHSEAIDAAVLALISDGRQLLRGNSLFGPDRTSSLVLEVWHNSPEPVDLHTARIVVRELEVPAGPH